jgi:two-component system, OmpR family, copper resistance phosphate regulon response regulator CusR
VSVGEEVYFLHQLWAECRRQSPNAGRRESIETGHPESGVECLSSHAARRNTAIPVKVGAQFPGELALIDVQDEGRGIPAELLARIFDLGFTTTPGSPGLGLAVCKKIVEQHGGEMEVHSKPKEGTRFAIGVAEADASLAEFLQSRFQQEHFVVQLVSMASQLANLPEKTSFGLLLLDLGLPGLSGLDALRSVQRRWPETPVIVLSATTTVEERVRGLNAGADDFVVKPFAVAELIAIIHAVLRRQQRSAADVFSFEDLEVNRVSHKVCRAGRAIELSPKEYALLEYLLRNSGRPVARNSIIEEVWCLHSDSITNVVDVYINYLRKKIDAGSERPLIRTIHGIGYQIGGNHHPH